MPSTRVEPGTGARAASSAAGGAARTSAERVNLPSHSAWSDLCGRAKAFG